MYELKEDLRHTPQLMVEKALGPDAVYTLDHGQEEVTITIDWVQNDQPCRMTDVILAKDFGNYGEQSAFIFGAIGATLELSVRTGDDAICT